ncbi:glycosyltransferase family 117 protein [Aureibacter tunicatorum]|uniref:DUF2723 domain-containing protein n=1 Tax=Aureibacter tunicatorum TaxID=866807 RepID=A0AAE3XKI4_9BACT|nr:DUF2723 domain-containing protein [Aureibacter tunicatorum]MDR6238102.1 hypothetical protein [Aureibacter tunicatorum]BDD03135.1 membrane protein [Aureibacter tunicatorum]
MLSNYRKINDITGWLVFGISTLVYCLTVEPTASFWDCSEFIACSYKLEVPHPPGTPLFLLIGRLFSLLAGGDVEKVAYWINIMSALCSGFTILFLFWSITMLGRKLLGVKDVASIEKGKAYALFGAGVVGSLAYAFTDSFWFSAVEGEVYGMSSFFTAIVVWAMLKWDLIEDHKLANRWLIMIAYLMGLSIGVHLLNLVTMPALGLVYYFKKFKNPTIKGAVIALIVSLIVLLFINDFIIPGLPSLAGDIEVFFVNSLGLPFGSGVIFFIVLFISILVYAVYYSQVKQKEHLNTALLSFVFILFGYACYAIIPIRSSYNPPIDENDPETIVNFVSYLKREQYGSRPLFYGQYYDAEVVDTKEGAPIYAKGKDKYVIEGKKLSYEYDKSRQTLLPRIYSNAPQHVEAYKRVLGLGPNEKPGFGDNIKFMFVDQIGRMYIRYLMWNFSGRESDNQGAGYLTIADAFKKVPDAISENKARNNYLMLPLILGIIGLFFNFNKDPKTFAVIGMLFIMTGVALVVYLNMPPIEPRERDYIFVGSFYAFAMWIGFGVLALWQLIEEKTKNKGVMPAAVATIISLSVPVILIAENYDDHDRSDRYFSVDSAKNFLDSCAPNAIIFTGGDNDTFPLWYVQEVEGYRTDVRVIVLSYFNTDWYIEQMMRRAYESQPLPFSFSEEDIQQGGPNDYILYNPNAGIKGAIDAKQYISLLRKKSPALLLPTRGGGTVNTVPSKTMFYNIDTAQVQKLGIVPEQYKDHIVPQMTWNLKKNAIEKNTLMIIDLITNSNWERPIYFNNTSLQGVGIDLKEYVIQEGAAYRLLPIKNPNPNREFVDTDLMYENMMTKFKFRELDNPNVYYSQDYRQFAQNARSNFNTLARSLVLENRPDQAKEVVNYMLDRIPNEAIPFDFTTTQTIATLLAVEENDRALEVIKVLGDRSDQLLTYYEQKNVPVSVDVQKELVILSELIRLLRTQDQEELLEDYMEKLARHRAYFGI